jgi:hypothetical protein
MTIAPSSIGNEGQRPAFSNQTLSPTPVLVTQRTDRVWIAKLLTWAGFSVEGSSREDALSKLDQQVKAQLADGEIAYLNLPLAPPKNPWLEIAGKYQDDPNWEEYQAAIASERQAANEIEGIWLEGDGAE